VVERGWAMSRSRSVVVLRPQKRRPGRRADPEWVAFRRRTCEYFRGWELSRGGWWRRSFEGRERLCMLVPGTSDEWAWFRLEKKSVVASGVEASAKAAEAKAMMRDGG
jgi:hypothetical protein